MKEITPEMLDLALMYLESNGKHINKIKITSEFADYLNQTYHPTFLNKESLPSGIVGKFTGIPLVIDDSIENDYELEY